MPTPVPGAGALNRRVELLLPARATVTPAGAVLDRWTDGGRHWARVRPLRSREGPGQDARIRAGRRLELRMRDTAGVTGTAKLRYRGRLWDVDHVRPEPRSGFVTAVAVNGRIEQGEITMALTRDDLYPLLEQVLGKAGNITLTFDSEGRRVVVANEPAIPTDSEIGGKAFRNPPADLDATQQGNVRAAVGAGTSSFSGAYADLSGRPSIPTDTTLWRGAFAVRTAYEDGDIVTSGNAVFVALADIPDTNTAVPVDGSTWAQLDVGDPTDIVAVSLSGAELTFTKRDGTTETLDIPVFSGNYSDLNGEPTDSELGATAFRNPPGDLTGDQKSAVLQAVGAGSSNAAAFDSGTQSNPTDVQNHPDTDAVPMPDITVSGAVATEAIAGFGTAYRATAELLALEWTFLVDATQGVGIQLRFADAKPTASDDAKNLGTLCHQANDGSTGTCLEIAVPANRWFWLALSGGGTRTLIDRSIRAAGISG